MPSQREEKDGIGRSLGQNMHGFDFEGMGPSVDRMRKGMLSVCVSYCQGVICLSIL